jgi:hypothetical protein
MIGDWQFQAGFRLPAEDLPVRLSATTSYAIFWPSFRSRMAARSTADMGKYVGPTGIGLNEPEALRCIEPFYCTGSHSALLSNRQTNVAEPLFIARRH